MPDGHALERLDSRPIPETRQEIRAFLIVRNEALRLPATLRHYRELGVDRFFVVDNESNDGTLDLLGAQPDVHIFSASGGYAASGYGLTWTNTILDAFANGCWSLTVDADELFIYPHYEEAKLPRLCQFLDSSGARAVFCLLLDMYADTPIRSVRYRPGSPLLDALPFFDRGPYRMIRAQSFPHAQVYGGVRERVFRHLQERGHHSPTISKVPLVKWQTGMRYTLSTHALTPVPMSDLLAVLLHFKFLGDFHDRVETEVARGEHFDGAREYRAYHELLRDKGDVNLFGEESVRFENSAQLLTLGLMRSSAAYERFVEAAVAGASE